MFEPLAEERRRAEQAEQMGRSKLGVLGQCFRRLLSSISPLCSLNEADQGIVIDGNRLGRVGIFPKYRPEDGEVTREW
jgi:hypothetical protein